MNPRIASEHSHDRLIDEVFHRIGSAIPPAGMEDRIKARLVHESSKAQASAAGRSLFFGFPRIAFGAAAAAITCVVIVIGSVRHSHSIQPVLPGVEPHSSSAGIGSAGAARPADRPVTPSGRPRSVRRLPEGRAVISPQSQKPAGVAVPRTPAARQ
jgi:hypothetical protein